MDNIHADPLPPMPSMSEILRRAELPPVPMMDEGTSRVLGFDVEKLLAEEPIVPEIGQKASQSMEKVFAAVADDVERLAKDGVDRAAAIHQEALSYAAVLRESGQFLCRKIEEEAARSRQLSLVMRKARDIFAKGGPGLST